MQYVKNMQYSKYSFLELLNNKINFYLSFISL